MTKKVLNTLFLTDTFASVNFAMTRFPQVIRAKDDPVCEELSDPFSFDPDFTVGHYASPNNTMTGDDNSHITPANGFFEDYLHEILCVPFPTSETEDSIAKAQAWVDFNESFHLTGNTCTNSINCGEDICVLNTTTNNYECAGHTNPELRATGSTPLGRSLFYAGEYLRKRVVVDGMACQTDEDCQNMNYFCSDEKTCFDPLRDCRSNTIVLFTDGVESPETSLVDFFNPLVQAKRLHYGLGCAFDSDCLDNTECSVAYTCQGYSATNGSNLSTITYIDGDGANKLTDHAGSPIQVTVHVVDMSEGEGETANRAIADHGGGIYYPVGDGSPDLLFEAFSNALDVKANIENCAPSFPDSP